MANIDSKGFRPGYHIYPKKGWMNDPNGLVYHNGAYHVFYQHYPDEPKWGPMHWAHVRSSDFIHWERLPMALTPKGECDGCFSGSGLSIGEQLVLVYTGHHNLEEGFFQNQNMAVSDDGIHFQKCDNNPIIKSPPRDNTHHFRDPKIWAEEDGYYMVIGGESIDHKGRALLYHSKDLLSWEYKGVLAQKDDLGYMWECPDFFTLDNYHVLTFSPMGIPATKDRFANLHQTGYLVGKYNCQNHQFDFGEFEELDFGHDFYAVSTMVDHRGRRIAFAWLDMWEERFVEEKEGWAGMLSLPRELFLNKQLKLCQRPVEELKALRKDILWQAEDLEGSTIAYHSLSHLLELNLSYSKARTGLGFEIKSGDQHLHFYYHKEEERLYWIRNKEVRQKAYPSFEQLDLRLFVDRSSLELFVGDGEVTFSSRFYGLEDLCITFYGLRSALIYELEDVMD